MTTLNTPKVVALKAKLAAVRAELNEAMAEAGRREVEDYTLHVLAGPTRLSAMFDGGRDLFIVHNMGVGCANCTLWADGFNGVYPHIASRAAFFVCTPDPPQVQAEFARKRGWVFPMVSHAGTGFAADMGLVDSAGRFIAGVSAFQKDGKKIMRVSATNIQPGDLNSSPIWHLLAMLPEGADGWMPKMGYSGKPEDVPELSITETKA
jgi:predicted dithiol-disulfide oxidoreductase (DUF899 family)